MSSADILAHHLRQTVARIRAGQLDQASASLRYAYAGAEGATRQRIATVYAQLFPEAYSLPC